jgi:hypothetical protein
MCDMIIEGNKFKNRSQRQAKMSVRYCSVHARALTAHRARWIDFPRLHILPLAALYQWLDHGHIDASAYAVLETRCDVCDPCESPRSSPGYTQQEA